MAEGMRTTIPDLASLEAIGRLPPQSLEAEGAVLGAVFLDSEALIKIADTLRPEDFYKTAHTEIFRVMNELFERHEPVDLITVTASLEAKNLLEMVGGATYVASLSRAVPSAAHIEHHAKIVRDKAILRGLIRAASKIEEWSQNEAEPVASIIDRAEQELISASAHFIKASFLPIRTVLEETFERIDRLHREKGTLRGLPTGFRELDQLLAGLQKSDLIVVAARPSMGKTSFVLNIAEHVSVEEKLPVGVFSLEMSREQLVDRLLASIALVDSWKMRTGNLADEDFPKINFAMGLLSEAPLYIDDTPTLNVTELRTKARRLKAEHNLSLLIVDYLQLMEGTGSRRYEGNRVQEISEISRALKALARELTVPVLAVSQLSRAVELRSPKIPQLSDLRESGSIEQDADVVIFIYREDYYERETERKNIADILIRKHRNGPIGQLETYFHPEQMRFTGIERHRAE